MSPLAPLPSLAQVERPETKALGQGEPTPKELQAARQFEAIFVRKLLSSFERTQSLGGGNNTSSSVYGSMLTGALADAVTQGSGIGLSEMVLKALSSKTQIPEQNSGQPVSGQPASIDKP